MENIAIQFGKRVRNLRVSQKYSQEKLAEYSGLHATYIGQIERGEKSPTIETIYKLAKGLDIPMSDFFKYIKEEEACGTADKIYNEILALSNEKQEKIFRILQEILQF